MLIHPTEPTPPGFDPFLRDRDGAELATDSAGISRGVDSMLGREVVVAVEEAEWAGTARMDAPLTLRFSGPCPVRTGQQIAVSDHRGLRYVGMRARVRALYREGRHVVARLEAPDGVLFYPGRGEVRLDGTLGASVVLEFDDELVPARGVDISASGVGLLIPALAGFVTGAGFTVHMRFADDCIELPAIVRSAHVVDDSIRLGVEFAGHHPLLESRVRQALG